MSSNGFVQNTNIPEIGPTVPSLPELFDELERDIDFESLEQLAESLFKDIARDLEVSAKEADCQVSLNLNFTSKILESRSQFFFVLV